MKKLPLFLVSMLCFTALVTYINANACTEDSTGTVQFDEYLQGTVSQGTPENYGPWMTIKGEIVMGTGTGDLVGSPITFTLWTHSRRLKVDDQKSFILGKWTFVSSSSGKISGVFVGKGTTLDEFEGKFMTDPYAENTGIYADKEIRGDFICKFAPLPPYGAPLGYEAWWNGTISPRGEC